MTGLKLNASHAFHIHDLGDLRNGCLSLSGHYNPFNETHGGPESCSRHIGDLGNIQTDANGVANYTVSDAKISLIGPFNILGRSCVIHDLIDDLGLGGNEESLKTGNAGPRIGCGVVGRAANWVS